MRRRVGDPSTYTWHWGGVWDACDDSIHRCAVKCEMGALDSPGASASTVASVAYEMVRVDTLASSPPGSGSYPPSSNSS